MPRLCIASRFVKYKCKRKNNVDVFNDQIHPKMVRKRCRTDMQDSLGYAKCFILGTFFKHRRIGHAPKVKIKKRKRNP